MRAGAQQSRGNAGARGDNVRSQFSVPDLNFPLLPYECSVCQTFFKLGKALDGHLRALALKNANTISKGNLAFAALKSSASKNCKGKYCKFFCNTAIVQFYL